MGKNHPTVTNIEEGYTKKNNDSPSGKKKQNRIIKFKWTILVLFYLTMMISAIYFISPYSEIREISVSGSNEVFDQEVIDSSGVRSGESVLETYFDRKTIFQNVKNELPQVKSIQLYIEGLNNFRFDITEYKTVAYLKDGKKYYHVLENGKLIENSNTITGSELPTFISFSDDKVLKQMLDQYNKLDKNIKTMISEMEWIKNDRNPLLVKAYMNNGNEILASIPSFSQRMQRYPQLVRAVNGENGLFDLEAGAYFLPFSTEDDQKFDKENGVQLDENSNE